MKISYSLLPLFFFTILSNTLYSQNKTQEKLNADASPIIKKATVYVVSMTKESKNIFSYEERFMSGGLRTEGKIKSEKKRKRVGHWVTYYESGNIDHEGAYVNNKKHGMWKWYFESGKVAAIEEYKSGKRISTAFYNENGDQVNLKQLENMHTPPQGMESFYKFIQQKSHYLTEATK